MDCLSTEYYIYPDTDTCLQCPPDKFLNKFQYNPDKGVTLTNQPCVAACDTLSEYVDQGLVCTRCTGLTYLNQAECNVVNGFCIFDSTSEESAENKNPCLACPDGHSSDGMGGCRGIIRSKFNFGARAATTPLTNGQLDDTLCRSTLSANGITLKGTSTWSADEYPQMQYMRGVFFDQYTYFDVIGLVIPWDGSFQINFWFKHDSRNSQAVLSSNCIGRDSINRSRYYKEFTKRVGCWSIEARGLSSSLKCRDRVNDKARRNRLSQTENQIYKRYYWSLETIIIQYNWTMGRTLIDFLSNCAKVSTIYANFSPLITDRNEFYEDGQVVTRTLGSSINYMGVHTMTFYGFMYEFEFIDGIVPLALGCKSSLEFDALLRPMCGFCPGRCVENVLEGSMEPICLDECWDGSYRVTFNKGTDEDDLWEDICEQCDRTCYSMWTFTCAERADQCICVNPAWAPFD